MRIFLLTSFSVMLLALSLPAQRCPSSTGEAQRSQNDPQYAAQQQSYENTIQEWIAAHPQPAVQSAITIPVVVHVVWKTAAQNISDQQIYSQLQVLNEDYGRTNPDTSLTPAAFHPLATATGIQFCLAQTDPNGNATTGIDRVQTTTTGFSPNDWVKHNSNGGVNAWDPTRYFNIWVCNLNGGMRGYAEFPANVVSQTFGLVMHYACFGSNYTAYGTFPDLVAPYDRGRTATAELAHCFYLFHIENDPGCGNLDLVADTPTPADTFQGCHTYPLLDACNPVAPGVMVNNFMAYYPTESCMNFFTPGQAQRMLAILSVAPYNLLATSSSCVPLGVPELRPAPRNFSVVPNPSDGTCTLGFSGKLTSPLRITSVTGEVVLQIDPSEITGERVAIDVRSLAEGMYFLQGETGGVPCTGRLVIVR